MAVRPPLSADALPELARATLFASAAMELAHVRCQGRCRHRSAEECTHAAQLVFPTRGVFVRHVGQRARLADANQVLYFGAGEPHQVSHPVAGGDDSLVLTLSPDTLADLAPTGTLGAHADTFVREGRTLPPAAQLLRARIATRLDEGVAGPVEAESQLLELARLSLGATAPPKRRPTRATRQLVERVKLVLAEPDSPRMSLADLGRAAGASPVYLTQVFRDLEGVPLYRYQLQLRLARALARLPAHGDLAQLALELGFSSHAQLTTHFRATYGVAPTPWLRALGRALKNREAAATRD